MSSDSNHPRKSWDLSNQDHGDIGHRRVLRRTTIYLDTPTETAIKDFMSAYSVEHYKALAERAQKLLEAALKDARDADNVKIQFRITCRAKTTKSLKEKLEARDKKRHYATPRAILEDVPDLAGVRVVLYTPNKAQRSRVKEAIEQIWGKDVQKVEHGDPVLSRKEISSKTHNKDEDDSDNDGEEDLSSGVESEGYVPKHLGYQADHYRACMRQEQGDDSYTYKDLDKIEIQVISALGHAWAEAGHDIMYKTRAYGNPTKLELRILDALSGLITSGDLLLEEFRESVTKRTYARWKHPEELTMWLRKSDMMKQKEKKNKEMTSDSSGDHPFGAEVIGVLYRFLRKKDKNYPTAVRDVLKELRFPKDSASGLKNELARFKCGFEPPQNLLVPFCIISRLLPREENLNIDEPNGFRKCIIMLDAFILLQTFSGSTDKAKAYLINNVKKNLKPKQEESMSFVLGHPMRFYFSDVADTETDLANDLRECWNWFNQQAEADTLCGFLFRLANMSILSEEMDLLRRMGKLQFMSLSEDDDR